MSLYRRKGSQHFWCRFTLGKRRIQQSTGTADRQAAEEYEERLRARVWREVKLGERSGTWEQAVKRWHAERQARPSTVYRDRSITDWFGQVMVKTPLSAINSDVIAAARKKLLETRAKSTVNRFMAVLSSVLNSAVGWGWIQRAPKVPIYALDPAEPRFITHAEFARLLTELAPHLRAPAQFAVLTGLRSANIRDLVWGRVSLERAHVWIPAMSAKGRRAIGVILPPEAVEVLRGIKRVTDQDHVFLFHGEPFNGHFGKPGWRRACRRAGLEGLRFHDLRHTWASWLMQAGVPGYAIQAMGGWASPEMVQRYAHLSPEHLRGYAAYSTLKA